MRAGIASVGEGGLNPLGTNSFFWAGYIRSVWIPQVEVLRESVLERALPAFEPVADEADAVSEEKWNRLTQGTGPDADPGILAEAAQDAGIIYYELRHAGRQAVVNAFVIALYHLIEQQLVFLFRREWLSESDERRREYKIRDVVEALENRGVEIEASPTWECLEELRLTANVAKHADGRSCERLRVKRPDLLLPPILKADPNSPLAGYDRPIEGPLSGDDLWVTDEDLQRFFQCCLDFLEYFADALEA